MPRQESRSRNLPDHLLKIGEPHLSGVRELLKPGNAFASVPVQARRKDRLPAGTPQLDQHRAIEIPVLFLRGVQGNVSLVYPVRLGRSRSAEHPARRRQQPGRSAASFRAVQVNVVDVAAGMRR